MIKKILLILVVVALVASFGFVGAGCKETVEKAPDVEVVEEETPAEEAAEEVVEVKKCRLWFWGEDEAVGLTAWWEENAKLYNEMHPDVEWEITHLDIDAIYTGLQAAMEAGDAPELHTVWSGMTTLQYAFTGEALPVSDYVSEEAISHVALGSRQATYWNGKLWSMGYYLDPWYSMYNKQVWADSGLDPDNPPTTYEDFLDALQKIKDAGFTPYAIGMKDGYYADFFSSPMGASFYNDISELRLAVLGEDSFADAPHNGWWKVVQDLRDRGFFNEDAMSLSLGEVMDVFAVGDVGFTNVVQPQAVYAGSILGDENIGVMVQPVPSDAALAGYCPIPANPLMIPAVAKYPEEAGKFLEFATSMERQLAMYESTGAMPISDLVDPSVMKKDYDKVTMDLILNKSTFTYQESMPVAVLEAMYSIAQELVGGNIDADEAAIKFEEAAAKWRQDYPNEFEKYKGLMK